MSYSWCNLHHGSIFAYCDIVGEVLEELWPQATYGNCVARRHGRQIFMGNVWRFKNEVIGPEGTILVSPLIYLPIYIPFTLLHLCDVPSASFKDLGVEWINSAARLYSANSYVEVHGWANESSSNFHLWEYPDLGATDTSQKWVQLRWLRTSLQVLEGFFRLGEDPQRGERLLSW